MVVCAEQGTVDVPLEMILDPSGIVRLHPDVQDRDFFTVALKRTRLTLKARGWVGYIPLNDDVVVLVSPRARVRNLTRMARIGKADPRVLSTLRSYAPDAQWDRSARDLYAESLIRQLDMIAAGGFLRGYERREAVLTFPHGRLLAHRTLQDLVPRGVHHAVHSSWFERTVDTPANRCLKHAVRVLAEDYARDTAVPAGSRRLHRQLNARYPMFAGVATDNALAFLGDPVVTGERPLPESRWHYREALDVALAVIQRQAVRLEDTPAARMRMSSMAIDMNTLFEAYVRNVLVAAASDGGWPLRVLDGNGEGKTTLYEHPPSGKATPDVVLRRPDGSWALVIEVKNVLQQAPEASAVHQALTYAVRYGTGRVLIVHPRRSDADAPGLHHLGMIGGVAVDHYRLDLDAEDMPTEEREFATAVRAAAQPRT